MVEDRTEGDGCGITACEECSETFLLDIAPSKINLLALLLVDLENLVCHILSLR